MAIEVDGPEHVFSDRDLIYAATARCSGCGAGLAYVPGFSDSYDCSSILLGTAIPAGIPGAVVHCDPAWRITSRIQPESDDLGTTRPGGRRQMIIIPLG